MTSTPLAAERASASSRFQPEVLATLALACAAILLMKLGHDEAWYLVAARRLLDGERLYVDVLDTNPPLVFWLMAAFARLGQALQLSDSTTANALPAVLISASTLTAARVLALAPAPDRWRRSSVLCGFLLLAAGVALPVAGQRDHLAAILLFPYALLAGRTSLGLPAPASSSILCGLLAAFGVALKPYFVLPWLAVELVSAVRRRSLRACWRIDSVLVVAVQCAYLALAVTLTPEYFTRIIPLAAATYGAYDVDRTQLLSSFAVPALGLCGIGALLARRLLPGPLPLPSNESFVAIAFGFLASFVLQGKGFFYHLSPALVFAPLALLVSSLDTLRFLAGWRRHGAALRRRGVWAALVCVTSAGLIALPLVRQLRIEIGWIRAGYPPEVLALVEAVRGVGGAPPIYVLSTSIWPAFPVVNLAGARWPYHFNCLWPLPAFYRGARDAAYRSPDAQGAEERAFFETVVDDLVATPPRILVVDHTASKHAMAGMQFEFLPYFSGSPAFAALLRGYRSKASIGSFEVFERL